MADLGGSYSCKNCQTCSVDGNKFICFDPDVKPQPGNCLIYSFGVGGELTWDTAMTYFNCSVYAFDMTMKTWDNGLVKDNLHFLALGLGAENIDANLEMHNETHPSHRDKKKSFFRTLETVRGVLDHNDRPIDILKLDIEFSEWDFFESLFRSPEKSKILQDVKQIALEIHLDDLKHDSAATRVRGGQRVEGILENLHSYGFQLVHTELNTAFQVFADVRGEVLPLFRESLYVRRP
ncbi:uncharacterized protein LOC122249494 [Penaeus japonicus]|uniref:uncharacterized protein LOC122249494 n=1 Tax=Penaeus japonicus TaxID=27405 RepID=UPI001C70FF45|nr:uncharacterized protein LOC122249494 [Penaeus japonicus]